MKVGPLRPNLYYLIGKDGDGMLKKCILIPDSFKGTLTSQQAGSTLRRAVQEQYPDCEAVAVPVADGGEGTVDCFLQQGARKIKTAVTGPFGEPLTAAYARLRDTAVIEIASAAGLPLAEGRLDPCRATTYGVGELIAHAAAEGCREIVLGLGGSCTNDAGIGMARALGARFFDSEGQEFAPRSDEMKRIARVDNTPVQKRLSGVTITAMCDVENPLYGENGAAYVYAPQKGADPETCRLLDDNLRALSIVLYHTFDRDFAFRPGAGAAGGLGAGVLAFLNGTLRPGIDTVLDLVGFDRLLEGADLVVTGEGRIDGQTLSGKVISGVALRAQKKGVPVIAIAGDLADGAEKLYDRGVTALFSINRLAVEFEVCRPYSEQNLYLTMRNLMRFSSLFGER